MEVPAPIFEANVSSGNPEMTMLIAMANEPSMSMANLPTQKDMESSTPTPEVMASVEEMEILASASEVITFVVGGLSQEVEAVLMVELATQILEEGAGPIAEGGESVVAKAKMGISIASPEEIALIAASDESKVLITID